LPELLRKKVDYGRPPLLFRITSAFKD